MNAPLSARLTSTCPLPIQDRDGLKAALAGANLPTLLMVYMTYRQDEAYLDRFAPFLTSIYAANAAPPIPQELAADLRERLFVLLTDPNPPAEQPIDPEL